MNVYHHNCSVHAIKFESVAALAKVLVNECGEDMVDLRKLKLARIHLSHKLRLGQNGSFVRSRVAKMLMRAAAELPAGLELSVRSAYRSRARQRRVYARYLKYFANKNPNWSRQTLMKELNKMVFPPNAGVAPFHSTGGAVDVFICTPSGRRLKHWDHDKFDEAAGDRRDLSSNVLKTRALLSSAMLKVGFSNYPAEFWHWSYGDTGWAFRTGAKWAIYDEARL